MPATQTNLKFKANTVIVDKHPDYYSSQLGDEIATTNNCTLLKVQHHKAHFASVLHENSIDKNQEVLGVVWDGVGLGDDGQIWGSEFFHLKEGVMKRVHALQNYPYLGNDKMAYDPIWVASILGLSHPRVSDVINEPSDYYWKNIQVLINSCSLYSSSMGRLFDAVSGLLGLNQINTYEGYSAMLLQESAEKAESNFGWNPFEMKFKDNRLDVYHLIHQIIDEIVSNGDENLIALRFHQTLVNYISKVAFDIGVKKLAFSGGVFQNSFLVKLIRDKLESKYELLFHKQLSPNDENISLGQLAYVDFVNDHRKNEVELEKMKI